MTTERLPDGSPVALPGDHHVNPKDEARLKAGAVGLFGVLFMAVANAAPITAMSFNVPIAVGYGNGTGASAGFLFATIVLTIFTIGFIAMARYITTTGAFYGFISQGLGQVWGMASGLLAAVAYIIFEGSLIGGFAYFASDALSTSLNISINWLPIAIVGIAIIAVLSYYSITLAAGILSVTLITEVLLLAALGISVLIKGAPDGFGVGAPRISDAFSNLPENAFGTGVAAGTAAVGIFFAFWSWIGYETTAVYGEESKEPKKIVPRATIIAVVGLGLFYTFMSWMVVAGQGGANAVKLSAGSSPVDLWLTLVQSNLGTVPLGLYKILLVVGSFACAMAFHNAASRYLYAMGREAAWPGIRNTLGKVNVKHGSPAIASTVQSVITLVLVLLFTAFTHVLVPGTDGAEAVDTPALVPYVNIYGILALIGTAMILIVQTFTSFAVISYFWVKKTHTGNVITTLICPLVGAAGMIYALFLLWQNRAFAAGLASESNIMTSAPFIILGLIVLGFGYAFWVKSAKPEIYAEIGQTTLQEAHERV